jgi:hypothetical protein
MTHELISGEVIGWFGYCKKQWDFTAKMGIISLGNRNR